jgi:hypothetical protein
MFSFPFTRGANERHRDIAALSVDLIQTPVTARSRGPEWVSGANISGSPIPATLVLAPPFGAGSNAKQRFHHYEIASTIGALFALMDIVVLAFQTLTTNDTKNVAKPRTHDKG